MTIAFEKYRLSSLTIILSKSKMKAILNISILIQIAFGAASLAQSSKNNNWQLLDPDSGKAVGTAVNTVYSTLVNGRTSVPILVAVIDNGTDTAHVDLIEHIWNNPKEIAGNGIDDDGNGYVDDTHGWNFIGGDKGNTLHDNIELTRFYKLGKSGLPAHYSWKSIKKSYKKEVRINNKQLKFIAKINTWIAEVNSKSGKDSITAATAKSVKVHGLKMKLYKKSITNAMEGGYDFKSFENEIRDINEPLLVSQDYYLNLNYDGRAMVNDHYENLTEHNYGNHDVTGQGGSHGTHVAGIIGAVRNNNIGMNGIAENVKIMVVRVVPDGDERDKDVANGIRYAADNGARLINMSFVKEYSPNKSLVDEAVKYAATKGVLIIHAAGNESSNNDNTPFFPNQFFDETKTRAENWIEVGASNIDGNPAKFSNYGKSHVDLFAPGVAIYSTVPDNKYESENGTSMAAPVVCGVAALVLSYFPALTVDELKNALLAGVQERETDCSLPGNAKERVKFSSLCGTGGIINAKTAFLKAEEIAGKK